MRFSTSTAAATVALLSVALTTLFTTAAYAQSYLKPKPPHHAADDRFRLEVDVLYGRYDTRVSLDNTATTPPTPGTDISAEQDFGLPSSQVLGQVELTLLPGHHSLVRLNALSMRRSGTATLDRDISWDQYTLPAGGFADSFINLSMIGLTYGYLPWRTDRFELAATFGIQIASVSARAEVPSQVITETKSAAGAFPEFGLEGRYDFTRRWSVDARWEYLPLSMFESLGVDLSGAKGNVTDARFAIRWRQNQHLVFGLGYRYFKIDVDSPQTSPSGSVLLSLTGPMLFAQASL